MTNKIHFSIMMYLFTIHLQGDVLIKKIQLWLTVLPSLHNN